MRKWSKEHQISCTADQSNKQSYSDLDLNSVDLQDYESCIDTSREKSLGYYTSVSEFKTKQNQRAIYTNTCENTEGEYENAAISTRRQRANDCYEVHAIQ